ncbi:uncharacterized protein LOC144163943 [Haemaphysalis longicornis]
MLEPQKRSTGVFRANESEAMDRVVDEVSEEQTKAFIIKRHELDYLFTGKRNAAKQGWLRIIGELGLKGISVEQCRKKWLNLLRKYKDLKNPPTGSGNEEGELQWPFFDLLDSIMSGRAIINPPRLVASASTAGNAEEPPSDEAAMVA